MRILAIDPGSTQSAWVVIDATTCRPLGFAKEPNEALLDKLWRSSDYDEAAVEMVASYGMAVGADVFETCVWIGRYIEAIRGGDWEYGEPQLVTRHPVKLHHCGSVAAKDSTIRQALVDRFAPGERNHGKGTKAEPGWFHGFAADCWQAYALAVYLADTLTGQAGAE